VRLWELDWDLVAHEPADWDEGARPYLEAFLSRQTPYAAELPTNDQFAEENSAELEASAEENSAELEPGAEENQAELEARAARYLAELEGRKSLTPSSQVGSRSQHRRELPTNARPSKEMILLALTRHGQPRWTEDDFQRLLRTLGWAGYGWLRPDGVRRELQQMAATWQGPPRLPEKEELPT
jgi:hypothetical protein